MLPRHTASPGGASWRFWAEVTRSTVSATRGDAAEFATLLPVQGDPWVKVQATGVGPVGGSTHLDLDVPDPRAGAEVAVALGARPVAGAGLAAGFVSLVSPGGYPFCLTTAGGTRHTQVRDGEPDLLDQLCLDLPAATRDAEIAFWSALTGWEWVGSDVPEFGYLARPDGMPLRLLTQDLGEPSGTVRGHVDLACVDRAATTQRHVGLGARVVSERGFWSVLHDPVGRAYCLTDRTPTQSWVER